MQDVQSRSWFARWYLWLVNTIRPTRYVITEVWPGSDIEPNGELYGWRVTGQDPQLYIPFIATTSFVRVQFRARITKSEPTFDGASSRLYFDTGDGFEEAGIGSIPIEDDKIAIDKLVSLPGPVIGIRLEPTNSPCELEIDEFVLHTITGIRGRLALARQRIRRRIRERTVLTALRFVVASLFAGHAGAVLNRLLRRPDDDSYLYEDWIRSYDTLTPADVAEMRRQSESLAHRPLISVIMPVFDTPIDLLRAAIESVRAQVYENWELCIADDCSTNSEVRQILAQFEARDPRIKVVYRAKNGHIAAASNSALELATGEWLALLDHDDLLAPHALYCVADAVSRYPDAQLIYSDEDKIDLSGERSDPYFKCDWNYQLFLGHNLISHLGAYRTETVRLLDGFREGLDGSQDYDLALRVVERISEDQIVHLPYVLYHWRTAPGSTSRGGDEKPYAMEAGERALNEHFERRKIKAKANLIGIGYRVDYELPSHPPLVSIIIPTRNAKNLVQKCITSIQEKTDYKNFEIIVVDNGSDDPDAIEYFSSLADGKRIRIIRDDSPFNYSALNNRAARKAKGTILALVNNDIEVISPDWLTRLVSIAMQPGIGAVGAKLLYPNDTIQHGGVIMGLGGLAWHAHKDFPGSSPGYMARAALTQNFSAVTGACLVVRRDHYWEVGGLNEKDLAVSYNDVDFCLKLTEIGLKNVWTPFAVLYHHESATRGYDTSRKKLMRTNAEKNYMLKIWSEIIERDPAYSPNLTLNQGDFGLAFPPRIEKPWLVPERNKAIAGDQ